MPNILAHTYITSEVLGDVNQNVVLGSTLPDFQGMYMAKEKVNVLINDIHPDIEKGRLFHRRTDTEFYPQPENSIATKELADDLRTVGIADKAARLAAHFAYDILLDTALLEHIEAMKSFDALKWNVLRGTTVIGGRVFPSMFANYIENYFYEDTVRRYADMGFVALISKERLRTRGENPNKQIPTRQLPKVEEVLSAHSKLAGELGMLAMAKTIDQLRQEVS